MNSPFNKSFISKSPLRKHKGLQRKLKKVEAGKIGAEQGDIDYDLVADLQRQIKDAKAAHNTNQRTEEGDAQVREDEETAQGSGIEMKSSPLHGYVDASDAVDSNPPTAHMWTKVFDAASSAYREAVTPKDPCAGLTGDSLAKCKNAQYETKSKKKEDGDSGESDKKTPAEALAKAKAEHKAMPGADKSLTTTSIDGKFVKIDADGNVTHRMSKGEGAKWISVDDINEF
tara:strand:+ start:1190 stop:1876 length:687 start_codon:yes stop_codon:yes gene_type:complete